MIKPNQTIEDKLNQKTSGRPILKEFIEKLFENERNGKNFTRYADSELTSALKKSKENRS